MFIGVWGTGTLVTTAESLHNLFLISCSFDGSGAGLTFFSSFVVAHVENTQSLLVPDGKLMLLTNRERRSVMDLDLTSVLPVHSRKSSLSLIEKASLPGQFAQAQQRRLSASQIIPIVSQSLLLASANGLRRSPLAPLDFQLSVSLNTDTSMADNKDVQMGRKPSITLTNATRPTPYSQRSATRRTLPSQQRRTSLPALHLPTDAAQANHTPAEPVELTLPQEEDIYSRLSTFTFGDAHASSQHQAPLLTVSRSGDGSEAISPLQRLSSFDRTPRPSIAQAHSHSGTGNAPPVPSVPGQARSRSHGWSSPSEDEDDVRRNNTRSKMRALDDGTRRPSLPTNDLPQSDAYPVSGQTEKGKSKTPLNLDRNLLQESKREGHGQTGPHVLSSPSSHTDGEGDMELTDVDLMSVNSSNRRGRKEHDPLHSDRSSVHTFGGDGDGRLSSDVSSVYGDDEDEHDNEAMDEDEDSRDPLRKDSARTWTESMGGRRRSLPMAIPQPGSSHGQPQGGQAVQYPAPHIQRYDDIIQSDFEARAIALAQYRRPSRSMDDDSQRLALHLRRRTSRVSVTAATTATAPAMGGTAVVPSSEPDMRSMAFANAIAQAQAEMIPPGSSIQASMGFPAGSVNAPDDSPYEGLDLSYILSVSGPVTGPAGPAGRGSDAWSGRLSVGSSVAAREGRERENSWAFGWGISAGGRRPSTATVNDDTFLRFVKNNDYSYDERRREWSFLREKAEGDNTGLVSETPGEEIWRCLWVGRYKVERVKSKNTDPNKPAQMRLNVKHIPDPYSKGNKRGGPLTFIHKHSRAQAFSIFRGHRLPQRHLKTSSSILLAPKKVQEQFTSTRTTSKLSTHGLLEEKSPTAVSSGRGKSAETVSGSSVASATGSSTKVSSSSHNTRRDDQLPSSRRTKEKSDRTVSSSDRKGKGADRSPVETTPNTSQSTFNGSTTSAGTATHKVIDVMDERLSKNPVSRLRDAESRPTSSLAETSSMTSDGSHVFSSALSAWDQSSIGSSQRHSARSPDVRRVPPATRGSVASLDDQPVRTSHQEAFATLDPPFIEYLRMHSQNYDGLDHESHSRFKALKKLFNSQATKNVPKSGTVAAGSPVSVLEGHYTPPWLTMAARSKQEEQERVIKNLNDSFRDVGLLPSFKPNERNKARANKKGKRVNETVFDQIPDESLYMLLPMWPGETDHATSMYSDQEPDQDIPLEERQYLLVYYVPMLSKEKTEDKKRSRQSQTSSANSHHSDSSITKENKTNISLNAFNVLARLVSYKDIYGSGIRIPTNGLSVTGPIMEAIRAIPHIPFHVDDLSLIIGFCDKRERGVEIVPEGCEKLGLCLPRTSPDPDLDAPLSSLGRAAVEMAWLGALAVSGFSNVAR